MDDSGSVWQVHGTPTGLVDHLPQISIQNQMIENSTYTYTGHVWGRVYGGIFGMGEDYSNRVTGEARVTYGPRDHYGPGADDIVTLVLWQMWGELPNGELDFLPGMFFHGDVGTNRTDPGYDPLLDTATFTLPASQYDTTPGTEAGTATGSFYGPNGEAVAGTFWYRRGGHRIEGAFGAERE